MPIYAYRCETCGLAKDVLQKVADPVLSTCPACGAETFRKQLTAAGFQLKGSGWYVTDFRGGDNAKKPGQGDAAPASGAAAEKNDKSDKAATADKAGKPADSAEKATTKAAAAPAPSADGGPASGKPAAGPPPAKS